MNKIAKLMTEEEVDTSGSSESQQGSSSKRHCSVCKMGHIFILFLLIEIDYDYNN